VVQNNNRNNRFIFSLNHSVETSSDMTYLLAQFEHVAMYLLRCRTKVTFSGLTKIMSDENKIIELKKCLVLHY